MDLQDLGYDDWFRQKRLESNAADRSVARVTRADRDRYLVRNETAEVPAELTGKMLFSAGSSEDLPCVGDWVFVQYVDSDTHAVIHDRFPRKTVLRRKSAGKRIEHQLIASNIDAAFVMQSCDFDFNIRRMQRYLVMVNEGGIEPVILLSKSDLVENQALEERKSQIRQARIGAKVIALSHKTGVGLDAVRNALAKEKTYCLLGSSGVGKTTLLNHLIGREVFETNPVREKDGRGKHTTPYRQLIVLDNGALMIDTPGMRELGLLGVDAGIEESFSDIRAISRQCRFNDCTHTKETGCAVLTAIERGDLDEARFRNYLKLLKESEFHQMSYAERRRRDRDFGRMVKSVLKHKKSSRR